MFATSLVPASVLTIPEVLPLDCLLAVAATIKTCNVEGSFCTVVIQMKPLCSSGWIQAPWWTVSTFTVKGYKGSSRALYAAVVYAHICVCVCVCTCGDSKCIWWINALLIFSLLFLPHSSQVCLHHSLLLSSPSAVLYQCNAWWDIVVLAREAFWGLYVQQGGWRCSCNQKHDFYYLFLWRNNSKESPEISPDWSSWCFVQI